MASAGEQKFRAKQIYEWLHVKKANSFDQMTNIPFALSTKLKDRFYINDINISKKLESCVDNTVKYLYRLADGNCIESVLMSYKHGKSLCISSQVGCRMGCSFCASGISGLKRNLTASEMLLQLYETEKDSGTVDSIVIMGIGEPLDNYENVVRFLRLLSFETGRNMSLRHVSLSTCGIVPKIYEMAELGFGLTLSVSLHSAFDFRRSEIMPVNKTYNISDLIGACRDYYEKTGRRVSFEYAVIKGFNDSERDAEELSLLLKGMNCHINLIPVNTIKEKNFSCDRETARAFAGMLLKNNLNATVRRTLGTDILAACGQLRRDTENI